MWILFSSIAGIFLACFFNTTGMLKKDEPGFAKFIMASGVVSLLFLAFAPWDAPLRIIVFAVGAGFAYGFSNAPFFLSYNYLNPLTAVILAALMPGYIAIGAWAILGEKMTPAQFIAFAAMLSGSLMAAFGKRGEGWNTTTKGVALMMVALVFSTIYNLMTRQVSKEAKDVGITAWQLFAFNRAGFLLNALMLLMFAQTRRQMLALFRSRMHIGFYGNDMLIAMFVMFAVFAIGALPGNLNTGFVNVAYYAVAQVLMFGYFFFVKKESGLVRKLIGASIAFAGLLWLATHGR